MIAALATAAATGLAGSLHCSVMCGPLAAAAHGRARYQAGRLASYAALGAAMGALGEHALCELPVGTVQTVTLLLVAAFAIWRAVSLVAPAGRPRLVPLRRPGVWARLVRRLPRGGLGLGVATGFLPCGMLVPAWVLAAGSGGPGEGTLTMAAFWAGTLPGLILPAVAGAGLRRLGVRIAPAVQAGAWGLLAVWLVLRPLLMAAHHH